MTPALPGTTVDFTIPAGFFSVAGDTVRYGSNPPAFQYDFLNFGAVPTDGCTSLNRIGAGTFTATNSPENFGGLPGIVFAEPSDINGDLAVNVLDLIALLLKFGTSCS